MLHANANSSVLPSTLMLAGHLWEKQPISTVALLLRHFYTLFFFVQSRDVWKDNKIIISQAFCFRIHWNFNRNTFYLAWVVTTSYDTQHVSAPLGSLLAIVFDQLRSQRAAGWTNWRFDLERAEGSSDGSCLLRLISFSNWTSAVKTQLLLLGRFLLDTTC